MPRMRGVGVFFEAKAVQMLSDVSKTHDGTCRRLAVTLDWRPHSSL